MIERLLPYKSIAIIGMDKNCGKTTCFNYLLSELADYGVTVGVTSVGVDGERTDAVTRSPKPEIVLREGTVFVTSEHYYHTKRLSAELFYISKEFSATGRMVTAKTLTGGKIILAGPSSTVKLKESLKNMELYGAEICLVDGAISRKSLASPFVTEATLLATGAALSANYREVVEQTLFAYQLMHLAIIDEPYATWIKGCPEGISVVQSDRRIRHLPIRSLLQLNRLSDEMIEHDAIWYITGAVTDKELLSLADDVRCGAIVVPDFTHLFITAKVYRLYLAKGRKIYVLNSVNLVAITVNPYSPYGYHLNSKELIKSLSEVVEIPVIDVRAIN